jgi:TRAP-type C4-dicarboxylate transport system substrate-binding protein
VLAASGQAFAQTKINLTIAAGQPPRALPAIQIISDFFIPEVNKRIAALNAGIEIAWKEAYAGSLIKPYQILDGIKDGIAEIGYVPTVFFPDKLPLENVTFYAPFATSDVALMGRLMNAVHKVIPEMGGQYDAFNQVRLGGHAYDSFELLTTFPVRKFDDLKGKKIASAGGALAWLRGTGAVSVQSNMMEYYNGTKNGVFEGFISAPSAFPGLKFPEAAPYVTRVGFGAQYATALTINKDAYRKFPEAARKILHEVGEEWAARADTVLHEAGEAGIKSVPGFKGQVYEMPREERVRWANAMPNIAKEWARDAEKRGFPGTKVLNTFMDELRKAGVQPIRDWDKD